MSILLISQDKKAIFDISQCFVFIPEDDENKIYLRTYATSSPSMLAEYKNPKYTKLVFRELIKELGKTRLLLTTKTNIETDILESAKKYFERVNNEKLITVDNNFIVTPLGNQNNVIYEFPEDNEELIIKFNSEVIK